MKVLAKEKHVNIIGLSRSKPSMSMMQLANFCWEKFDLMDGDSFGNLVNLLASKKYKVSGLVNNAGTNVNKVKNGGFDEITRQIIEVNLTAPLLLINCLRRFFINGASIVNITSIASQQAFPQNPAYVSSKSGLSGATRAFAYDLADRNIRVNSVAPGYIPSEMTRESYLDKEGNRFRSERALLKRWGTAKEIANVVGFLLSENSAFITGQEIVADGGWTVNGF